MARIKETKPLRYCWDCVYAKPYDIFWNRSLDGKPLTCHCYRDPNNIKRGLLDTTLACIDYKRTELIWKNGLADGVKKEECLHTPNAVME